MNTEPPDISELPRGAARKGVATNKKKARAHAREIYAAMRQLQREGFAEFTEMAAELHRRGFRGSRDGRITRERLYEIRQRLGKT